MIDTTELYEVKDGKLSCKFHAGQAKAWRSDKRFVFVIAGTQGGKTSFIPFWLDREIQRMGHGDYLAATASYDLFKLKFLPEMRHYFVDFMGWEESKSDRVLYRQYKPRMFDRIILRSASSEGGLESTTAKAAVLDECGQDDFRVGSWEAVLRRLSLARGRVLGATTPYNLGWLKTEIFDKWKAGDEDIAVVQFKSIQNPAFPREEYESAKKRLPTWKFEMFYNGNFTRPAGLIYEDVTDQHFIKRFVIPPHWERYVGVDFGAVNQAGIWVARDPDKDIFIVYRETLKSNYTTKEHCEMAKRNSKDENVVLFTGGAPSETQQRMDWSSNGINVLQPLIADVESGIDKVVQYIKEYRLYFFDDLPGIKDELGTYQREVDEQGNPTEKIKDKNEFHYLDCLRYVSSRLERTLQMATVTVTSNYAGRR